MTGAGQREENAGAGFERTITDAIINTIIKNLKIII